MIKGTEAAIVAARKARGGSGAKAQENREPSRKNRLAATRGY